MVALDNCSSASRALGSGIAAGNLRPLAVSAERRLTALPDVPMVAQANYAGLAIMQWYGLMAPAFTTNDACGSALNPIIFLIRIN